VVAVGGDGTVLRASALLYPREVPLLAVHAGSLGFLTACDGEAIEKALADVVAGRHRVERRTRILVEGPGFTVSALNDAVVVGRDAKRFTELEAAVDGEPALAVEGDGLIVATPTGSTAYALAAGGPVLCPSVSGLLLVPLAAHRLGARPLVVPMETRISIHLRRTARVLADGDAVRDVEPGTEVQVRSAQDPTLLVRLAGTGTFFARLQDKLGWPA